MRGKMPPLYMVLSASCFSPQVSVANLASAFIRAVHFLGVCIMWYLKFSLLSIMIHRCLMLLTCSTGLLFKCMDTSLFSLLLFLVTTITLDFYSLKVLLLSFAQFDTFLISMFATFSASRTVSSLTAISKSLVVIRFPNSRLSNELYWMFQKPGPQHDPCE